MATYYQQGSTGNEVKTLQDQLRAAGFDPGISDGIYGKNTAAAVTSYQKAKGLTVDGIAGTQTLGALNTPIISAAPASAGVAYNPQTGTGTFDDGTQYEKFTYENGVPTNAGTGAALPPVTQSAPQTAQPDPTAYTNLYSQQEQQALADYQAWASQPYVSQYAPELEAKINEILSRSFNYDPANDAQFQLASKELTRNVLETMNARGILNSTVTENQVQQGVSDLLPQYQQIARQQFMDEGDQLMSQVDMLLGVDETQYNRYQDEGKKYADVLNVVMNMSDDDYKKWTDAYERRYQVERDKITDAANQVDADRQKNKDAWERTSELGYVDNASSLVLGVSAGTLSKEAREAQIEREQELADAKTAYNQQLGLINAQYEKEQKVAAMKADSTTDAEKLGDTKQVQNYYELRDIYFGGGTGTYANDPLKAYNWLVSHAKDNIALMGQGLYNKLLAELTENMKVQKSYGESEPTQSQYTTIVNKAYSMKNPTNNNVDSASDVEIVDYIINSGLSEPQQAQAIDALQIDLNNLKNESNSEE